MSNLAMRRSPDGTGCVGAFRGAQNEIRTFVYLISDSETVLNISFVDLDGNRYVAIGTDKFLLIYFEGQLYDITPLKTTLTSATLATTNTSAICSITTGTNHNLSVGDIVLLGDSQTDAILSNLIEKISNTKFRLIHMSYSGNLYLPNFTKLSKKTQTIKRDETWHKYRTDFLNNETLKENLEY